MIDELPDSVVRSLGRATAAFEHLSAILEYVLWLLLFGAEDPGYTISHTVTAELSFRQRVNLLSALFRVRFPGQLEESLKGLVGRLNDLEQRRNQLVHSFWLPDGPDAVRRIKVTARGVLREQDESITAQNLESFVAEVFRAEDALDVLLPLLVPDPRTDASSAT